MNGRQLIAKPAGMAAGAAGGAAFRSAWRHADHGRDVPKAGDSGRSWRSILLAAALQGAVFAIIHAVVDRVAARQPQAADPSSDVAAR